MALLQGDRDVWQYDEDRPTLQEFEDRERRLENIEEYIHGVLSEIYGDKDLDIYSLEWYLEELASQVGVNIPKKQIRLQRTSVEVK